MNTCPVITAAELRLKPEQNKRQHIERAIMPIYQHVLSEAVVKSSTFYDYNEKLNQGLKGHYKGQYNPTMNEIIDALKEKLVGCNIEYLTMWVDVAPGRRQEKSGILIDWSE